MSSSDRLFASGTSSPSRARTGASGAVTGGAADGSGATGEAPEGAAGASGAGTDAASGAAAATPDAAAASGASSAPANGTDVRPIGLAHVGALSFLASRAAPSGAFAIALAGGVALARAGERLGARQGYGASLAAMIQTVAYLGPARLNGPLTQALTAPMMGALERRGVGWLGQFAACATGRILHNTLATAFFVFVLLGLDAYAGTYDEVFGRLSFLPSGAGPALGFTGLSILVWAAGASAVQVHLYRHGLRRWPSAVGHRHPSPPDEERPPAPPGRFDPRAVAVAAGVAFVLLLATTEWPLLAAVAAWLAVAWALSRPDHRAVPAGVVLALLLGGGALLFSLTGGLGLEVGLRRASRAILLVLVATWLRAAAGAGGVREVARRSLGRLRRIPSVFEAAAILDELRADRRLGPSARALLAALGSTRKRPLALVGAVLDWVAAEAEAFRSGPGEQGAPLRLSARDGALLVASAAPAIALLGT
jgi:hypothetical protein